MKKEYWIPVKNFEGFYEISNLGRVKRLNSSLIRIDGKACFVKERILKTVSHKNWYPSLTLRGKRGQNRSVNIHRLVAEHFIPNPENKPHVNHIDGNKGNFNISNLEWVTQRENEIHSFKVLGKKSNTKTLKNYSKEWETPFVVNGVKFHGKTQKKLYHLFLNGVNGIMRHKLNVSLSCFRDFYYKLIKEGFEVELKSQSAINPLTKRGVRSTFYKIIKLPTND